MTSKLIVGPFNRGLRKDRTPFVIDNDSFPFLINAYQWRGRVKRKRGNSFLGRLTRFFDSISISYNTGSTTITLDGSGVGNLLTGFSLESTGNIVPGSVTITIGVNVYTDPTEDGYLTPTGTGGVNTINYATGEITIPGEAGNNASAMFLYYPGLPVLGLEDLLLNPTDFPGTIAFDNRYSYNILTTAPYDIYDVSFYKNPASAGPNYVPKTNWTPVRWNGEDYQQFWTINYENAFWETNGVHVPFNINNIGMQYKPIVTVTIVAGGPPAQANLQITGHNLVVGDFVFVNEVATTTGINLQTGYVITVLGVNNVVVEFPAATIAMNGTGGIAQYLTSSADPTIDCIRFYDGDPTDGNPTTPSFALGHGWVNFMPPLSNLAYSIADLPEAIYYLVGAKIIFNFKDRFLAIGAVVQAAGGSPKYLQDTIVYSEDGTPYYTVSFTGDALSASTTFTPMLVPDDQTAIPMAFFEDVTGFGGFLTAGLQQAAITVSQNEDVLIIGFAQSKTRMVFTGNDIIPFNLFLINSEHGDASTFSTINLDDGVITKGIRGYIITSQTNTKRMDLPVLDEVFEVNLVEHGNERFCSQRDFINEWIYFTYPSNASDQTIHKFPNKTLFYNYRDDSWATFIECYTTYGQFHKRTGATWQNIGSFYPNWLSWNDPWNAGESTLLQPDVIAGNQQGFICFRGEGTGEPKSLSIISFSGNTITSPNHCLNNGDYIYITGALGTISTQVNGKIFSVYSVTTNTFKINPSISSGTYFGEGLITRLYVPFIQTKQFPSFWEMGRKTRIGNQMYLLTTTETAQMQLLLFLSQNAASPYNAGSIIPDISNLLNSSLIYSTVLYTCPESTNLGLTPANINLQTPTAIEQEQIWHRINTSLIGDTVQLGFTLSDTQMRTLTQDGGFISQTAEIELHGFILDLNPSQLLV